MHVLSFIIFYINYFLLLSSRIFHPNSGSTSSLVCTLLLAPCLFILSCLLISVSIFSYYAQFAITTLNLAVFLFGTYSFCCSNIIIADYYTEANIGILKEVVLSTLGRYKPFLDRLNRPIFKLFDLLNKVFIIKQINNLLATVIKKIARFSVRLGTFLVSILLEINRKIISACRILDYLLRSYVLILYMCIALPITLESFILSDIASLNMVLENIVEHILKISLENNNIILNCIFLSAIHTDLYSIIIKTGKLCDILIVNFIMLVRYILTKIKQVIDITIEKARYIINLSIIKMMFIIMEIALTPVSLTLILFSYTIESTILKIKKWLPIKWEAKNKKNKEADKKRKHVATATLRKHSDKNIRTYAYKIRNIISNMIAKLNSMFLEHITYSPHSIREYHTDKITRNYKAVINFCVSICDGFKNISVDSFIDPIIKLLFDITTSVYDNTLNNLTLLKTELYNISNNILCLIKTKIEDIDFISMFASSMIHYIFYRYCNMPELFVFSYLTYNHIYILAQAISISVRILSEYASTDTTIQANRNVYTFTGNSVVSRAGLLATSFISMLDNEYINKTRHILLFLVTVISSWKKRLVERTETTFVVARALKRGREITTTCKSLKGKIEKLKSLTTDEEYARIKSEMAEKGHFCSISQDIPNIYSYIKTSEGKHCYDYDSISTHLIQSNKDPNNKMQFISRPKVCVKKHFELEKLLDSKIQEYQIVINISTDIDMLRENLDEAQWKAFLDRAKKVNSFFYCNLSKDICSSVGYVTLVNGSKKFYDLDSITKYLEKSDMDPMSNEKINTDIKPARLTRVQNLLNDYIKSELVKLEKNISEKSERLKKHVENLKKESKPKNVTSSGSMFVS